MDTRTSLQAKADSLVKGQSTKQLLGALAALELGAPEPCEVGMPIWCKTVGWIEDELIRRFGCEDAHTDWVLSDDFGADGSRTSYTFLSGFES